MMIMGIILLGTGRRRQVGCSAVTGTGLAACHSIEKVMPLLHSSTVKIGLLDARNVHDCNAWAMRLPVK